MVEKDRPKEVSAGLGISRVGLNIYGSPAPGGTSSGTIGPSLAQKGSGGFDGPASGSLATQFFHADDAKSAASSDVVEEKPKLGAKPATFFYANDAAPTHRDMEPRPVSRGTAKQDDGNKFFYANEHQSSQPGAVKPSIVGKAMSPSNTSERFPSPEVQRNGRSAQRPSSPLKESSYTSAPATLGSPRSKNFTSPGKAITQESPLPPSPQQKLPLRRSSLSSTTSVLRKPVHQKSASTTSAQITPIYKVKTSEATPVDKPMEFVSPRGAPTQQLSRSMTSLNSPELSTSNSTSLVSTDTLPSSLTLDTAQAIGHASPLLSPTKSGPRSQPPAEQLQKMNELAANARRERKVLDLEISNSSLLAINKTLEREMRKQSAELRRFRRLSRSGRLSIATGSLRSMSGQSNLSGLAENDGGRGDLSDLEEMTDQDSEVSDDSDDDLDSSFDDDSSSVLSPTSRSDYDARHRAKDEKRLMLDLSKHQQLLIDSQKMSQSIKRCLGWTEELIKDGTRALAYHVKVSDVELGGRVLSRDDEEEGVGTVEEIGESSKGLLSPTATMAMLDDTNLWAHALCQLDGEPEGTIVDEPEVLQPD
jgi:hypothetical protein